MKITPEIIEKVKQIPIDRILGKGKKIGRIYRYKCPLHIERNPSFTWYTNTNSYFCFSCKKSGDIISLIQDISNCSFQEAIEYLTQFI